MAKQLPQAEVPSTPKNSVTLEQQSAAGKVEMTPQVTGSTVADQKLQEDESRAAGENIALQTVVADPETSLAKLSPRNSHPKVDQFFSLTDRFPIQIFNEETKLQKFAHWGSVLGPIVMGAASLFLALYVWHNTEKLTDRQINLQAQQVELQSRQNQLQNDQAQAELADLRFKFLNDLTATDENKKTPAEISLAAHGLKAFPVVHYALGVEQGEIRKSAVNVVYRLFQAETNEGREELLNRLMGEFAFPNQILHTGVVQSFVKVEPLLTITQRERVIGFLQQRVIPQSACSEQEGKETVLESAKFMGSKRADGIPYLMSVVSVARCGDAWLQAIFNLQTVAPEISAQERSRLRERVTQLEHEVLDHLHQNISNDELVLGAGFAGFLNKGELSVNFDNFSKRIKKEFDSLISRLGE